MGERRSRVPKGALSSTPKAGGDCQCRPGIEPNPTIEPGKDTYRFSAPDKGHGGAVSGCRPLDVVAGGSRLTLATCHVVGVACGHDWQTDEG